MGFNFDDFLVFSTFVANDLDHLRAQCGTDTPNETPAATGGPT